MYFESLHKLQTQFFFWFSSENFANNIYFQFRFALFNLETDEIAKNMLMMILISKMAFRKNGSNELQKNIFLFFAIHPDPVHATF